MIKHLRIRNYKALRDVSVELTPTHALIGPNDSGKTSILEVIAALCRSVEQQVSNAFMGQWHGRELVWRSLSDVPIVITALIQNGETTFEYEISFVFSKDGRQAKVQSESVRFGSDTIPLKPSSDGDKYSKIWRIGTRAEAAADDIQKHVALVRDSLLGVHFYRWDPRFLALAVAPDSKRRFRMDSSGFGLALCLDDILGYDRDLFIKLETHFTKMFPEFISIKLVPEPAFKSPVDGPNEIPMLEKSEGKGLYFAPRGGGPLISAHQVSDGVLLVLAYLTILHLPQSPRVLLVEEPENGIHPKRLQDVLSILRDLVSGQTHTQVVMTTHSPYVIDLFAPDEVSLCHKKSDGAIEVRQLSKSQTVREQLDVFTLGEIWTAEGDDAIANSALSETDKSE